MANTDVEQLWIDAWEAVYELVGTRHDVRCLLPDGSIVDVDTCLGWIQNAAYAGSSVSVQMVWISGVQGIAVTAAARSASG